MKKCFFALALVFLAIAEARADAVNPVPIIAGGAIVVIAAVAMVVGLVLFVIWFSRRANPKDDFKDEATWED